MNNPTRKGRSLPLSPNIKSGEGDESTIVRTRFSREGATSFVAHLDMMRIFERSLKRAGIPCEYSQGFNPRPVMAFALPLGVGVETIDDYVDITVRGKITPADMVRRMQNSFPPGISIMGAIAVTPTKESMMAQVAAAQYLFHGNEFAKAKDLIEKSKTLMVTKTSKGVQKIVDVKPLILSIEVVDSNSLKILVKAGSKENLRPDLLLESLVDANFFTSDDAKNIRIVRVGTFVSAPEGKYTRPM